MAYTVGYTQKMLNKFNAKLVVDGAKGKKTLFWLKGLQSAGKLKVDGIYGPKTHEYTMKLLKSVNKRAVNVAHFKQAEFRCHCCGGLGPGIHINLLILLEALRYKFGGHSVRINSGYRCAKHNKAVGGGTKSQHLYGNAADIVISGISPYAVWSSSNIYNVNGGVGKYNTFTHVDCRGFRARW